MHNYKQELPPAQDKPEKGCYIHLMCYLRCFLFAYAGLLLVWSPANTEVMAQVDKVYDGDTFQTRSGEIVRLLGINAPEPADGKRPAEPGGTAASAFARQLLADQTVRLVFDTKKTDRYDRTLAHVYLTDGTWVNRALVAAGQAHVYSFPDNRSYIEELLQAEAKARAANKGIWALPRWQVRQAATCCPNEQIGQFHLIEGVIQRVAWVKGHVYLNFGDNWRTDFTAEIPPEMTENFNTIWLRQLQGQRVRVRGMLKPVNGVLVTLTHPEQIEILKF